MSTQFAFHKREDLFDYLDDYAFERKQEIDEQNISSNSGLIKSYVLETSLNHNGVDLLKSLKNNGFSIDSGENNDFYIIRNQRGFEGYLEPDLNSRYWYLHSTQHSDKSDKTLQRQISRISQIDRLWLSGDYFYSLWNDFVYPQSPERSIKIKFETESRFENFENEDLFISNMEEDEDEPKLDDEVYKERRVFLTTITETAKKFNKLFPELQKVHPAFKSIKMLRLPASTRGGYEFWSWGKVTHRASSFREGREYIISITKIYSILTELIESALWLKFEANDSNRDFGIQISGAPLIIDFLEPLDHITFKSIIETTFDKGKGPLRLWGNPIWVSDRKVHVYGIDLHMWQQIFLEFTPKHIVAMLPKGTCGNTVHRLITNVQSYIDPNIEVTVAGKDYRTYIEEAFRKMGG